MRQIESLSGLQFKEVHYTKAREACRRYWIGGLASHIASPLRKKQANEQEVGQNLKTLRPIPLPHPKCSNVSLRDLVHIQRKRPKMSGT